VRRCAELAQAGHFAHEGVRGLVAQLDRAAPS
jgi:hypothetical protein